MSKSKACCLALDEEIIEPRNTGAGGLLRRLHYVLYFLDIAVLALSGLLFYLLLGLGGGLTGLKYAAVAVVAGLAFSLFGFQGGLYDWHRFRRHLRQPLRPLAAVVFSFGCLLVIGFVFKLTDDFSRLWVGSWFASLFVYVVVSRLVLYGYLLRSEQRRHFSRRAIILNAGGQGRAVLDHLRRYDGREIQVVGFVDEDPGESAIRSYRGVPILGADRLESVLRESGADLAIVALPWSEPGRIDAFIRRLSRWAIDIYLAPEPLGLEYADRPMHRVGGMHLLSLRDRPIGEWKAVVKRAEDLLIAVPALVVLSPLLALIALAIRLESRGPVLFVQDRYGFNNNLIRVYKFRSMYAEMTDRECERQTVKGDCRVTRVGRFIRALSFDELPQLINVVQGTMSVVGPRPHARGTKAAGRLFEEVVDEYAARHRVKPGITGWAQCNGWRGETDTLEKIEKRVEHDFYYIENWSVFLDLLIIFKTLGLLLRRDPQAY